MKFLVLIVFLQIAASYGQAVENDARCPAVEGAGICVMECNTNSMQCDDGEICCYNGCGYVCQEVEGETEPETEEDTEPESETEEDTEPESEMEEEDDCPKPDCNNNCDYGRAYDSEGCMTCDCADDPCLKHECPEPEVCVYSNWEATCVEVADGASVMTMLPLAVVLLVAAAVGFM